MISLKGGLFDPLTGTQNRDTAFIAYRMAHITWRADSSHHIFRLRTPANVLAAGAVGKRILFDISAFMRSEPLLVRTTAGAEIKFSLRTRIEEVAEFRRSGRRPG